MKILVSSRSYRQESDTINHLKEYGLEVSLNQYGRKMTEEELLLHGKDAVGIIAGTEKISKNFIEIAKNLKVISRYGIGMDNVDIKAANKKGILLYNTPDAPSTGVAELALTMMLNVIKKINIVDNRLKKGIWKPEMGYLLSNKKIGIIGLGRIGKALITMLKPFNPEIIAFDIEPDKDFCLKQHIKLVSLKNLLIESDIVSLHVPLNKKTAHMMGEKEFDLMKKSSILINTSRGGVVDENALYDAIKQNKIAGAGIDVFENEPDVGKLKELDNILLTPHIATYTFETRQKMEMEAANNLLNGLKRLKLL